MMGGLGCDWDKSSPSRSWEQSGEASKPASGSGGTLPIMLTLRAHILPWIGDPMAVLACLRQTFSFST
jgi:hypothetical protein